MPIPQNIQNMFGAQMQQAQAQAISPERQKWAMILAALGDAAGGVMGRPGANNMMAVSHIAEQRNQGIKDVENRQRLMEVLSGSMDPEMMNYVAAGVPINDAIQMRKAAQEAKNTEAMTAARVAARDKLPENLRGVYDALTTPQEKDKFLGEYAKNQLPVRTQVSPGTPKQYMRNGKLELMTPQEAMAAQRAGDNVKEYERDRAEGSPYEAIRAKLVGKMARGEEFTAGEKSAFEALYPNSSASLDPEVIQAQAQAIVDKRAAPITGYALRSALGREVMSEVYRLDPQYDTKDYAARSAAVKSFLGTGKRATQMNTFNTVADHLSTLEGSIEALHNKDLQSVNRFANMWKTQTGESGPTNFEAVKELVADEIVKAVVGTGAGALEDRKALKNTILAYSSPEQLAGAIDKYRKLIGGQLKTLKLEYENSTKRTDFDTLLTEGARTSLGLTDEGVASQEVPQAAVNALKQNPQRAAEFDAKFGAGAAKKVLGN